jgi:predicted dinucleotide-binding enzyme
LKIGIIDLGNIGENLGRLFSNAVYQIAISNSRGLGLTAAYFFGVLENSPLLTTYHHFT